MKAFRLIMGAAALLVTPVLAQQPSPVGPPRTSAVPTPTSQVLIPRSSQERALQAQASRSVVLNVLVTDALGKPVADLNQKDFTLLDDQKPILPASVRFVKGRSAPAPVHVMLVLDALNNSSRNFGDERKAVENFLGRNGGRLNYPTSIVLLTEKGAQVGGESRDGNALIAELKRIPVQVHVRSAGPAGDGETIPGVGRSVYATVEGPGRMRDLNERFKLSLPPLYRLAMEQENVSGRALVIWVGPGWPALTGPGFFPATPQLHENYFANIVELNTALREAQVTLDDVSTPTLAGGAGIRKGEDERFFAPVVSASHAETGNLALPVLVNQSGGRVIDTGKDLASEIEACIADADAYYVLSFTEPAGAHVDEYHAVEIRLDRSGLMVRTNAGYYAQP